MNLPSKHEFDDDGRYRDDAGRYIDVRRQDESRMKDVEGSGGSQESSGRGLVSVVDVDVEGESKTEMQWR